MGDRDQNIVLTGFMGTGKTTVGQLLAERLGWPHVDTDHVLEQELGRSIPEIFEAEGEETFRSLEEDVIHRISQVKRQIITLGGGAILNPKNRQELATSGVMICLRAQPETILDRVGNEGHRPLIEGGDKLQNIKNILSTRAAIYGLIPYQVDTDGLTPQQVVEKILSECLPE